MKPCVDCGGVNDGRAGQCRACVKAQRRATRERVREEFRSGIPVGINAERFWGKVNRSGDCWLWTSEITASGYGRFSFRGAHLRAHRVAYVLSGRSIPDGFQVDHLCRTRACVRPEHLEAVTQHTNIMRGEGETAKNARKARCVREHDPIHWITRPGSRWRRCSECERLRRPKVSTPATRHDVRRGDERWPGGYVARSVGGTPIYWIRRRIGGVQREFSTRCTTLAAAMEALATLEAQVPTPPAPEGEK